MRRFACELEGVLLARLAARAGRSGIVAGALVAGALVRELDRLDALDAGVVAAPVGAPTWEVPDFSVVLDVYRDERVAFSGSLNEARACWFARWRRPPRPDLRVILRALRADAREWRTREARFVPAFSTWIASGREELEPGLLPGAQPPVEVSFGWRPSVKDETEAEVMARLIASQEVER